VLGHRRKLLANLEVLNRHF
jgi:hypothetical protein